MPRPQSVNPKAILDCAADLFERRGFDGVTTHEIAAAAGVSEGALFRYFKSKEELFTFSLLLRSEADELQREFASLLARPNEGPAAPVEEALDRLSKLALPFFVKVVRALMMLALRHGAIDPSHRHEGHARPGLQGAQETLAEYLRRLEQRGDLRPGDAGARATAFLSGLFGYAIAVLYQEEFGGHVLPDMETYRRQFVTDWTRGIAVRPGE